MILNRNVLWILLGFALMSMISGTVWAQESRQNEEWKFAFTPFAWLVSINGSSIIGDTQSNLDLNFTDEILDTLNLITTRVLERIDSPWIHI